MKPRFFIFKILSSLRLTVTLLALSLALVFFGTLDQVHLGILGVQQKYFEGFLALWSWPAQWPGYEALRWLRVPVVGGYLLGPLLIVNLVCAHFRYFRKSWRKLGIALIHGGIVLLLIGQLLAQLLQVDSRMLIFTGQTSNFIERFHDWELAVIEKSGSKTDAVTVIPANLLKGESAIQHPKLPFSVRPLLFYPNTAIKGNEAAVPGNPASQADRGVAKDYNLSIEKIPIDRSMDADNLPVALVELKDARESLGVWLLPARLGRQRAMQRVDAGGRTFFIELRREREYLPYTLTLDKLTHKTYEGTDIPASFESHVLLNNEATKEKDRPHKIWMNHPLRYQGLAFYQYQMNSASNYTVLQVVRNPSWLLPYIACGIVAAGLIVQFTLSLLRSRARSDS